MPDRLDLDIDPETSGTFADLAEFPDKANLEALRAPRSLRVT
jgi:hypothetical protein